MAQTGCVIHGTDLRRVDVKESYEEVKAILAGKQPTDMVEFTVVKREPERIKFPIPEKNIKAIVTETEEKFLIQVRNIAVIDDKSK